MKTLKFILPLIFIIFFINCSDDKSTEPVDPSQLLSEAWTSFESGSYSDAVDLFTDAMNAGANTAECYCGIGWSNLYLENYSEAETEFTSSIAANDEYYDSYAGLGFASISIGNFSEALTAISSAFEFGGEDYIFSHDSTVSWWDLRLINAQAYFHTGEYLNCYAQLQILDPLLVLDPDSETFIADLLELLETLMET